MDKIGTKYPKKIENLFYIGSFFSQFAQIYIKKENEERWGSFYIQLYVGIIL